MTTQDNSCGSLGFKLRETNDALLAISTNPDSIPSQSVARTIQRHREVYQDYAREFQRTKVSTYASFLVVAI